MIRRQLKKNNDQFLLSPNRSIFFKFKMSERVKVAVRLRPLIEEELTSKDKSICIEVIDPQKKVLISNEIKYRS